jgi:NAD(P)-dependent dehydrogenase (short-subunit alcohol dehydrogenase family)
MVNILIIGGSGSIGGYLVNRFKEDGHNVIATTHKNNNNTNLFFIGKDANELSNINIMFDAVIWAHGHNFNDTINTFDYDAFSNIIDINVSYILKTLNVLLHSKRLNIGAKLAIISSIFEQTTRPSKLSYTISKSALSGLVKNVSYDISEYNMLINNVLLGVINNEMTQSTLSHDNIDFIKNYTKFNRLLTLNDVYNTIKFLIIDNTAITGQSIKVDLGFTSVIKYN